MISIKNNIFKKRNTKQDGGPVQSSRITRLIDDENIGFNVREAFKSTRTNVMFSLPAGAKSIVLSSANPAEGKTTLSINLSITFAQMGAKVLLIDCDLRKPRLSSIFDVKDNLGITNVIGGFCKPQEAIHSTKYENFYIMPSGHIPPNPTELLSSLKTKELIEQLCESYDYVFIDTPPINVVADATLLTRLVSGTILLVRQNITTHKAIEDAISKLKFSNSKILGFVLNDKDSKKGGYYSRYAKYGYYYE